MTMNQRHSGHQHGPPEAPAHPPPWSLESPLRPHSWVWSGLNAAKVLFAVSLRLAFCCVLTPDPDCFRSVLWFVLP